MQIVLPCACWYTPKTIKQTDAEQLPQHARATHKRSDPQIRWQKVQEPQTLWAPKGNHFLQPVMGKLILESSQASNAKSKRTLHYETMIATFACAVHNDAQAILKSTNYNGTNNHVELGKRARQTL